MNDISSDSLVIFREVLLFIDLTDYSNAISYIKKNMKFIHKSEDISLAYIICGFISNGLRDYPCAINDFSQSIAIENKTDLLSERSKDIPYDARSNSKYKAGDFKGSILDKRQAKKIRLIEGDKLPIINGIIIDSKSIKFEPFDKYDFNDKYKILSKVSKLVKTKYDLIDDFKKVINNKKKNDVIKKLEALSEEKYKSGDFKASIRAIRRAEKYY